VPLWSYSSLTGPTSIPLAAMAAAGSVSELPAILENAGFVINSVTATRVIFTANYVFNNLIASNLLKEYMCFSLACGLVAETALMSSEASHIGSFVVPMRLMISLVP